MDDIADVEYHSDGGDAILARRQFSRLFRRNASDMTVQDRKRRRRNTERFIENVHRDYGLKIVDAGYANFVTCRRPQSKCTHCQKVIVNLMARWEYHSRKCNGRIFASSVEALKIARVDEK